MRRVFKTSAPFSRLFPSRGYYYNILCTCIWITAAPATKDETPCIIEYAIPRRTTRSRQSASQSVGRIGVRTVVFVLNLLCTISEFTFVNLRFIRTRFYRFRLLRVYTFLLYFLRQTRCAHRGFDTFPN